MSNPTTEGTATPATTTITSVSHTTTTEPAPDSEAVMAEANMNSVMENVDRAINKLTNINNNITAIGNSLALLTQLGNVVAQETNLT